MGARFGLFSTMEPMSAGTDVLDWSRTGGSIRVTAALFGGERPAGYDFDFATTDRKLLAVEYGELANCVRTGTQPEVSGDVGREAVALICALFESQVAGRPVIDGEVLAGAIDAYQHEIDRHFGLV